LIVTTLRTFVTRHPVASYFVLTFVISWGGFVLALGPIGIPAAPEEFERMPLLAIMVMLVGPAVAGVLMTGLVSGREGFRDLLARFVRWRVGGCWYAVALLTAPVLFAAVLLPLSVDSPVFQLGIFASSDATLSLVVRGIVVALIVGMLEEFGWTGFAIPRLRLRYSVFATGLIVGVVWGAWHVLANDVWASRATAGDLPLAAFVVLRGLGLLVGGLVPFRVLMVWVYDRTDGSLLVAMLMHASYAASTFILNPLAMSGRSLLIYDVLSALAAWVIVAVVAVGSGGQLSRQPLRTRAA
jgi:CAAX protease family protein